MSTNGTNGTTNQDETLFDRFAQEAARFAQEAARAEVATVRGVLDRTIRHAARAEFASNASLEIAKQAERNAAKRDLQVDAKLAQQSYEFADLKSTILVEFGKLGAADKEQDAAIAEAKTKADEARELAADAHEAAEVSTQHDVIELQQWRQSAGDLLREKARASLAADAANGNLKRGIVTAISAEMAKSGRMIVAALAAALGTYLATHYGAPPAQPPITIHQETSK